MTDAQKMQATEALNWFWSEAFGVKAEDVEFDNESAVPFYYTDTLDGKHGIQFYADFVNLRIYFEVDNEIQSETQFDSFKELCDYIGTWMTESGIVGDADEICYENGLCDFR